MSEVPLYTQWTALSASLSRPWVPRSRRDLEKASPLEWGPLECGDSVNVGVADLSRSRRGFVG